MKTNRLIIAALVSSMLFSCTSNKEKEEQQDLLEISKKELATALEERDQLLSLVKEISVGLEQIKQLEDMMTMAANNPQENGARKSQILADIESLKKKIGERKERLQELETKLQNSTINTKNLKETIEALRLQIDSQMEEIDSLKNQLSSANTRIGSLNNTVDSLNTTVTNISGELSSAQDNSVQLENKLNTCFYVVAPKAELKSHKIIETGFLRKTKILKGEFDDGVFVVGDKRTLKELPLNSKKAKLLTNHPQTSYQLTDTNGMLTLVITNPDEFWSLTNYLVVQKD